MIETPGAKIRQSFKKSNRPSAGCGRVCTLVCIQMYIACAHTCTVAHPYTHTVIRPRTHIRKHTHTHKHIVWCCHRYNNFLPVWVSPLNTGTRPPSLSFSQRCISQSEDWRIYLSHNSFNSRLCLLLSADILPLFVLKAQYVRECRDHFISLLNKLLHFN